MMPARSESLPSVADTVCTACGIELHRQGAVAAARAPGRWPRFSVKLPEIEIWSRWNGLNDWSSGWMAGADFTTPSRVMAIEPVRFEHVPGRWRRR